MEIPPKMFGRVAGGRNVEAQEPRAFLDREIGTFRNARPGGSGGCVDVRIARWQEAWAAIYRRWRGLMRRRQNSLIAKPLSPAEIGNPIPTGT